MFTKAKEKVKKLKQEIVPIYYALFDERTPLSAKIIAWLTVGYLLSPIDLIPDFIPVVGYLDDLLIVPLGIWIALKLIPAAVMAESRERAQTMVLNGERPFGHVMLVVILSIWILGLGLLLFALYRLIS